MLQALGGGAAQPQEAAEEEGPVFRGFGSPLKPGPDSPDTAPVSICGAIGAAGASQAAAADSEEEADATSGLSPGARARLAMRQGAWCVGGQGGGALPNLNWARSRRTDLMLPPCHCSYC